MMKDQLTPIRAPLIVLAVLALLAGGWAGLARIGWAVPPLQPALAAMHGPLMVAGALGAMISLERAVALGRRWAYAAPLLLGLGGALLASGVAIRAGVLLLTLGSLVLVAIFGVLVRQQPARFMLIMALGALTLLIGNALWLGGWSIANAVAWWTAFLVLTIAGERLELGRLRQLPARIERWFVGLVALLLAGLALGLAVPDAGMRVAGAALLGLASWLLRYDIARRTVRKTGLTRYIAVCLLSGYVWLAIGGVMRVVAGATPSGWLYDVALHAVFVGFVFAMIFGHAPIIIPAVLGARMPFMRVFYAPLVLLHASLVIRVVGDLTLLLWVRQWGGMLNATAIVLFLMTMIWAVRTGKRATLCTRKHAPSSAPRSPTS